MAKITINELESLTANDAGRILREDGNLAGRISARNIDLVQQTWFLPSENVKGTRGKK